MGEGIVETKDDVDLEGGYAVKREKHDGSEGGHEDGFASWRCGQARCDGRAREMCGREA